MNTNGFRTIRVSKRVEGAPGVYFATFKSPTLSGRADVTLFVPRGYEERVLSPPGLGPGPTRTRARVESNLPIICLLHGVYGSHWNWVFLGDAHLTAQSMIDAGDLDPCILVMPSDGLRGDGTGYFPHTGVRRRIDYEHYIVHEVFDVVKALTGAEGPRCLGGLSMGGWGALCLGAKYPQRVLAVSAHSALLNLQQLGELCEEPIESLAVGEKATVAEWLLQQPGRLPRLRFDCGKSDPFYFSNHALHQTLILHDIPHEFDAPEGGHDWTYWSRELPRSFSFFAKAWRSQPKFVKESDEAQSYS